MHENEQWGETSEMDAHPTARCKRIKELGYLLTFCVLKAHGDGVNAVTQIGWGVVALTSKDVAQVRVAICAENLGANHAKGAVFAFDDAFSSEWGEE